MMPMATVLPYTSVLECKATMARPCFISSASVAALSACVACTGQLASAEWWEVHGTHAPELPPEATLQDVLRDLVEAPALPLAFNAGFPSRAAGELPTRMGTLVSAPQWPG